MSINLNSAKEYLLNQLLGANASSNLSAALENKVEQALTQTSTATLPTEEAVQNEVDGYVGELAETLLKGQNPLIGFVLTSVIDALADQYIAEAYAKYAPQAQSALDKINAAVNSAAVPLEQAA